MRLVVGFVVGEDRDELVEVRFVKSALQGGWLHVIGVMRAFVMSLESEINSVFRNPLHSLRRSAVGHEPCAFRFQFRSQMRL